MIRTALDIRLERIGAQVDEIVDAAVSMGCREPLQIPALVGRGGQLPSLDFLDATILPPPEYKPPHKFSGPNGDA